MDASSITEFQRARLKRESQEKKYVLQSLHTLATTGFTLAVQNTG